MSILKLDEPVKSGLKMTFYEAVKLECFLTMNSYAIFKFDHVWQKDGEVSSRRMGPLPAGCVPIEL